jgi:hypothetical protein
MLALAFIDTLLFWSRGLHTLFIVTLLRLSRGLHNHHWQGLSSVCDPLDPVPTLLSLYCFGVKAFTTTRGFTGDTPIACVTLLSFYCFGVEAFTTTREFGGDLFPNWVRSSFMPPHDLWGRWSSRTGVRSSSSREHQGLVFGFPWEKKNSTREREEEKVLFVSPLCIDDGGRSHREGGVEEGGAVFFEEDQSKVQMNSRDVLKILYVTDEFLGC